MTTAEKIKVIPRNIEITFLAPYSSVLLNRGQNNMAKQIQFGGANRTRVSSQAQKQRWAKNEDPNSIYNVLGAQRDYRSREIVTDQVMPGLAGLGHSPELLNEVAKTIQVGVYGKNGAERHNRPSMLLGLPEIQYIVMRVDGVLRENPDAEDAKKAVAAMFAREKANILVMNEMTQGNQGARAALFGRFITSFDEANIDSAVSVAHAMSTHSQENEMDHFGTVDDLNDERQVSGSAYMGESELTSCILAGYVVVDVPQLVQNHEAVDRRRWLDVDRERSAQSVRNLIMTIATVSIGAKKGSTAPFGHAGLVLVEAGEWQPRNLQEAFRHPVESAQMEDTAAALSDYISSLDRCYGNHRARRTFSPDQYEMPGAVLLEAHEVADWAADIIRAGEAE